MCRATRKSTADCNLVKPPAAFLIPNIQSLLPIAYCLFSLLAYYLFPLLLLSSGVFAQEVIPLPAVVPAEQSPPGVLVSHPNSSSQILQSPGETDVLPATPWPAEESSDKPLLPPGVRNGFFQKVLGEAAWLAPGGSNGLGSTDLQLQGIFAMPCPTIQSPLVITPGFAVHYLQGPQAPYPDLPPQLFESYVDFRWLSQVTPTVGLDFAVTPGVFSDFDQSSSKAFRLPGHAAIAWTWNETTKFVAGVAYLDRPDVEWIPIGGVIWTPSEDVKFDLVFPHPKISHRVRWFDRCGDDVQDWAYIAGEFTGDAWAIRRTDGSDDEVVLSDYRLVLGMEHRVADGVSSHFDVGYVFGRRVRYSSDTPDFRPSDTIMVRGGLSY
jgi:hypothetical protein